MPGPRLRRSPDVCGRAQAQAPTQIRISTAAPPSDFLAKALEQLKADVDAASVGLDVSVHPASTLFKQGTEVPALQRGNLEMSTMTTFEVAQQIPELGYFNRGYLLRDYDQLFRVFDGAIGEDFRKTVAEKMGIVILATHYLGTRQVSLRQKRAVKAPADLAGVKMRMPAGPEWLLLGRTLGVTPVPLGMPEVYLAMKTGTVDGQENPLSILNAAKFYEVSEQIVLTAHMVQPVFFAIAKPVWDKLNPDQRNALDAAARKTAKAGSDLRLADEKAIVAGAEGSRLGRRCRRSRAVPRLGRSRLCRVRSRQGVGRCRFAARAQGLRPIDGGRAGRGAGFGDLGKTPATGRLDCLRHVRRRVRHLQLQDLHPLFRARRSGLGRRSFGDPVHLDHLLGQCLTRARQGADHLRSGLSAVPRRGAAHIALARAVLVGGIFAWALPGSLDYIRFLWREHTPVLNLPLDIVYSCFGIFLVAVIVRSTVSAAKLLGPRWRGEI